MSDERIRRHLQELELPDSDGAEERGWRVARAAYEARPIQRGRPVRARRLALVLAAGLLAIAIGLSPAGAKVVDLIDEVVNPGEENAKPELTSLPAPGRLLVTSAGGSWVVSDDGSKRRLGDYEDAAWSPNGYYVAVTRGPSLTAVQPDGTVRWSLGQSRPVSDPAWAPSGLEIAYVTGDALHVVQGDGDTDRVLDRNVAPVTPAWLPEDDRNVLTFVDQDGRLTTEDVESGEVLWRSGTFAGGVESLQWIGRRTRSRGRLLVTGKSLYVLLDRRGRSVLKGSLGEPGSSAALSPAGDRLAAVEHESGRSRLVLSSGVGSVRQTLFSGEGRLTDLVWSPDGEWLVVAWPDADQWLFVRPVDGKVMAVSEISRQFAPAGGESGFPHPAGWVGPPAK